MRFFSVVHPGSRNICRLGTALFLHGFISPASAAQLPEPTNSGIDHIVVVMMENRSFDHMLGWSTNADGRQAGLTYTNASGGAESTYPLAPNFQGCAFHDPDHSYTGGRIEY